MFKTAFLMVE